MAGMDEGEGERGRGRARARVSEGEGERYRRETRRGELKAENGEIKKDGRGAAGLRVVTQSGITHRNEGDEATVAFYPYLILTRPDQGIYTTTATLCAK